MSRYISNSGKEYEAVSQHKRTVNFLKKQTIETLIKHRTQNIIIRKQEWRRIIVLHVIQLIR